MAHPLTLESIGGSDLAVMAHSVKDGVEPLPRREEAAETCQRPPAPLALASRPDDHPSMRRSRELKPLSSDHHQALLVAFQLKKGLAGHAETAGAPRDLPGLVALARRFDEQIMRMHTRAEEELLGRLITGPDMSRLREEHGDLSRLLDGARTGRASDQRGQLSAFADLLERHVRWEERELFPYAEGHVDEATLATIGGELEKRLVLARTEKTARR
jgi:Hemerythrin HHE cation binding domain